MEPLPGYDEWKTRSPEDEPERQEEPDYTCRACGGAGCIEVADGEWCECVQCHGSGQSLRI